MSWFLFPILKLFKHHINKIWRLTPARTYTLFKEIEIKRVKPTRSQKTERAENFVELLAKRVQCCFGANNNKSGMSCLARRIKDKYVGYRFRKVLLRCFDRGYYLSALFVCKRKSLSLSMIPKQRIKFIQNSFLNHFVTTRLIDQSKG